MPPAQQLTLLAIASYEKGHAFLREARRQGARVLLLTSESLRESAHWPTESIDEIFYMPDVDKKWNRQHTLNTVAYLARTEHIDRLVRWTILTSNSPHFCVSIYVSPAWAKPPRATFATNSPCE